MRDDDNKPALGVILILIGALGIVAWTLFNVVM